MRVLKIEIPNLETNDEFPFESVQLFDFTRLLWPSLSYFSYFSPILTSLSLYH